MSNQLPHQRPPFRPRCLPAWPVLIRAPLIGSPLAGWVPSIHSSGLSDPSHADRALTGSLKAALALVDISVLDHFIVAGRERPLSFAERGLVCCSDHQPSRTRQSFLSWGGCRVCFYPSPSPPEKSALAGRRQASAALAWRCILGALTEK